MKSASAPSYDLFKTIVAVLLAIILILMLLRGCAVNPASPAPTEFAAAPNATGTIAASPIPMDTIPAAESTETLAPSVVPTETEPATAGPTPSPTAEATELPAAATPTTSTTVEATEPPAAGDTSCNTRAPSRLSAGQTAKVLQRLNMRSEASIAAAVIQTNATNTQVEIIGGPVCTPMGDWAYRWWQIRLANGAEGWSAESPLNEATYFLEPVP